MGQVAGDESALESLRQTAIDRYLWLQDNVGHADLSAEGDFARRFCTFYRVRRSKKTWRPPYFAYMKELRALRDRGDPLPSFGIALRHLATNLPLTASGKERVEASFTSKLLATLAPDKPVWDKLILDHFKLNVPDPNGVDRIAAAIAKFESIECGIRKELAHTSWPERRASFDRAFRDRDVETRITDIKALDLLIWATRDDEDDEDLGPA